MNLTQAPPLPTTGSDRSHSLRLALAAIGVGVVLAIAPLVENIWLYLNVAVMGLAVGLPIYFQWRSGRLDLYEPIHLLGIISFLYFGLGAVWTVQNPRFIAYNYYDADYAPIASFYCLLGVLARMAGYWLPVFSRKRPLVTEAVPHRGLFVVMIAGLGVMGYMAQLSMDVGRPVFGGLTSSVMQLQPFFIIAWALFWLQLLSGTLQRHERFILLVTMIPAGAVTGFMALRDKSFLVVLAGVPLIALWYTRRRVPWVTLTILLLVLIFLIFPFVNLFRSFEADRSFESRVESTQTVVEDWSFEDYWRRSFITFQARMALINSVATIVRQVGKWEPYANGETLFMPALVYAVPRPLWPGKPTFEFGLEFGKRFRIVNAMNDQTSVAVTHMGELYWNFGVLGIVVGMFFTGILMRLAYRRYSEAGSMNPIVRAAGIFVLIEMIHFGGSVAVEWVTIGRTLLLFEALLVMAAYFGWTRRRRSVPLYANRG